MIKYTKVRNDFLERRDLTAVEKMILVYLYGRKRADGRPWDVNREQISAALNIGLAAVRAALPRLMDGGWITDNRKPVRGERGRIRREKSCVVESRRPEIVAMSDGLTTSTEGRKPTFGLRPSNEELSMKDCRDEPAEVGPASRRDEVESSSLVAPPPNSSTVGANAVSDFEVTPDDLVPHGPACLLCRAGNRYHDKPVIEDPWADDAA